MVSILFPKNTSLPLESQKSIEKKNWLLTKAICRKILLNCSSKRLTAFLMVLASGGCRAKEALSVRLCDCDFSTSPTKISLLAKNTKTGVARYFSYRMRQLNV